MGTKESILVMATLGTLIYSANSLSHSQHQHGEQKTFKKEVLRQINKDYVARVKPIFLIKCMDCHSDKTQYPWYHSLPGIKQLLDKDTAEGRKHLDTSHDFPFAGHGNPIDDLKEIAITLERNSMPPFFYKLMHPSSKITKKEKEIILNWIQKSEKLLEKP